LREPILIASFKGWNDAGDAASFATSYLASAFDAKRFASVDPEGFFDFQSHRPRISVTAGVVDSPITLPGIELSYATPPEGRSVVILAGSEPSLRWPTLCQAALDIAVDLGVSDVVTLGALIADVPHTRPVRLTHMSVPERMTEQLTGRRPDYEGPTGIIAMLHAYAAERGLNAASLWAAVPHYIGSAPAPNATLALLQAFTTVKPPSPRSRSRSTKPSATARRRPECSRNSSAHSTPRPIRTSTCPPAT
jgi:proteasome assembly chaperone (PAC2) family protein